jgi:DbpA RNA binding domain
MSGFSAFHVTEPVAAALARLGYSESDPYLEAVIPAAARGTNLVVVTPPAAVHALPALAGILGGAPDRTSGRCLVLVPDSALAEWETVAGVLARQAGRTIHAVRNVSRAVRLLQSEPIHLLLATPSAALALAQRSALKLDQVTSLFIAWPEFWDNEEALAPLMQDFSRDAQRIIYTTAPDRVADLVERHARRAQTVGPLLSPMPGGDSPPAKSAGRVRLTSIPWGQREQALREVIETLDPPTVSAWVQTAAPELEPRLPPGVTLAVRAVPATDLIVAYDLPNGDQLAQLLAAGEVVLLVPPAALAWARRVVPAATLLRLPGAADATAEATRARRARVSEVIEQGSAEAGLLALAPLFDRYDAASVAAALYQLWQDRPATSAPSPVTTPAPAADVLNSATARIWVGVGKKDGATANDFVAVLTKEIRLDRARIGKIEVRELYSLVEVPAAEAETLAGKLNGVSIRRRRVTAKIDRGGKPRSDK